MLNSVNLFKVGQNPNVVKQNPQKVSFAGSELSHSTNLSMPKADSFKKSLQGPTCGVDCCFI